MDFISIPIQWNTAAEKSLRPLFDENGITTKEVELMLKGGLSEGLQLATVIVPPVSAAVAAVLVAWLSFRKGRSITVKTEGGKREAIVKGHSTEEALKILERAGHIEVIENEAANT